MKIVCPRCKEDFDVDLKAIVPEEQRMTLEIKKDKGHEDELFSASAIAGIIASTEKALCATAKSIGVSVSVFISDIKRGDGTIAVELLIAENKQSNRKKP